MPTLSALPWEEREKILSSMGNDDKSSVAGSEEAEPQSPPIKPRETRQKAVQEAPPKKGRRSRRCGQCSGCQVPEDCGVCTNCLDKPKFGGRNIKKQCCKMRKCQNLQWMPSKMFLQKQSKDRKDKKKIKLSEKNPVKGPSSESAPKASPAPPKEDPPCKKSESPPRKLGEEKSKQLPLSKQPSPVPLSSPSPVEPSQASNTVPLEAESPPLSKEGPKQLPSEPKKKPQQHSAQQRKHLKCNFFFLKFLIFCRLCISSFFFLQKPLTTKPPSSSTLNLLSTPSTRDQVKPRAPCDGVHRIRVDFQRDHDVEKVWEAGGLSLLTSVPITPRVLCFLCASSGNVEVEYFLKGFLIDFYLYVLTFYLSFCIICCFLGGINKYMYDAPACINRMKGICLKRV
uniref:Lysine methyltransferase 2A n=1 Tax=Oryzias melastigma TaxID=30732 RepID=A0A3B3C9H2_ORYME